MQIDQMQAALVEARTVQRNGDEVAKRLASMLRGRLRHCNSYDLAELKRELRGFNIHTREWMR